MFKMRIINLVNISTVLLLINLLQTKSQGHSAQRVTVLTVSIYGAQLSDKMTSVPVAWTTDYEDPEKSAFKKLVTDSCDTFREYVKSEIPKGSVDGLCTRHIFQQPGGGEDGVSISLKLSFMYMNEIKPDYAELLSYLRDKFAHFQFTSSHKITEASFGVCEADVEIPSEDKDAIDGSKWKIIAIVASVTLIIVLIAGAVAKFGNCC
uniref:Somula protein n=1 Tax=Schistosoma japonicum TaxID=6182 RepID=C7TYY1_SCHJA|nr:Somula protein [Schistosoma japonicum]